MFCTERLGIPNLGQFVEHSVAFCMTFCPVMQSREPTLHGIFCLVFRKKATGKRKNIRIVVLTRRCNHIELSAVSIYLFTGRFAIVDNGTNFLDAVRGKPFALSGSANHDSPSVFGIFSDLSRRRHDEHGIVVFHVEGERSAVFHLMPQRLYERLQFLFQLIPAVVSTKIYFHNQSFFATSVTCSRSVCT